LITSPAPESQNKSRKPDLLNDPLGSTLYRTAVPTTIGAIAVIIYYLAGTYFVSLLGTDQLAALGFTFPATIMVTYFGVGLGIGTSALVGKATGSKNPLQVQEMTFASLSMGLLLGVILIFPAIASIDLIFPLLGAGPEHMPLIRSYMTIWFIGMPLQLMQFAGTAVIRASGNAKLHGKLMSASAVVNALLDPLFIFGLGPVPAMGIGGAAVASVITFALTTVVICYFLCSREKLLCLVMPRVDHLMASWKKLLQITGPAALANMITPLATAVLTATLATYGTHAVAAFGVVSRIEAFIMIVVLGMSMSVPPFISQNFGAHLFGRVQQGLRMSLNFVLAWQFGLYVLVALTAPWIAQIFTQDAEVQAVITLVLRILPASYAFQGMVVLSASSFNALHAPRNALFTSLVRFFVFYVPLALVGNELGGITGLFVGAALGNVLAGIVIRRWILNYTSSLLQTPAAVTA
jgi:putative MATE family efflux protein